MIAMSFMINHHYFNYRHSGLRHSDHHAQIGNTLVPLLIFVTVGLIVTAMAIALIIVDATIISSYQQSNAALDVAESGVENAMMTLLRNPGYTGEVLTVGNGTTTVTVTGTNPLVITSIGRVQGFSQTLTVQATWSDGLLAIQSWNQSP